MKEGFKKMSSDFAAIVSSGSVKNNIVLDGVTNNDLNEYSRHALAEVVDGGNRNFWILVTRYSIGK